MTSSIGMDPVDVALTNERNGYSSFDHDYTPSPEQIEKVNAAFDFIEANPKKWYQPSYGNDVSETNCFMGIIPRLNGVQSERSSYDGYIFEYGITPAMDILGLSEELHEDRAEYIANFTGVHITDNTENDRWPYRTLRHPTVDEMRERVSIALSHDFRKPKDD